MSETLRSAQSDMVIAKTGLWVKGSGGFSLTPILMAFHRDESTQT
ncbi:MAG: hypothetical protein ABI986_07195 [Chloroflexota bacterium]